MYTLCIVSFLVGKKKKEKQGYPVFAAMNLKYFSEIMELIVLQISAILLSQHLLLIHKLTM
jgi:hypothetical protein